MITFYLAMKHCFVNEVHKLIDEYSTSETKYVITRETCKNSHKETDGEHFHVVVEWDEKLYIKFKREVITKIWKLKGQARNGIGRQYGKEKVGNEDKMISYVLKDQLVPSPDECRMYDSDGNFTQEHREDKMFLLNTIRYQKYDKSYLLLRYDNSYQKEDKYTQIEGVIDYLKIMPCMAPPLDIWKVQTTILRYWMDNHTNVITKSTLNHITIRFITQVFDRTDENELDRILLFILGKST